MKFRRALAGVVAGVFAAALAANTTAGPAPHDPPVLTLIMDDLGYDAALARRTLALPRPFAVAILPDSPLARAVYDDASAHDIDVLLHLPMDAGAPPRTNDTVIAAAMTESEMREGVRAALERVPRAIGVNNHEGSVLTADGDSMAIVMDELRHHHDGLIFVDSRTNPDTVAEEMAHEVGLPTTSRDVFLDHDPAAEAVDRAVDLWLATARRTGCSLAIGHPREATLSVLERRMPRLAGEFDLVDLRTYIERCAD